MILDEIINEAKKELENEVKNIEHQCYYYLYYDVKDGTFGIDYGANRINLLQTKALLFSHDINDEHFHTLLNEVNESRDNYLQEFPKFSDIEDDEDLYATNEEWFDEAFNSGWYLKEDKLIEQFKKNIDKTYKALENELIDSISKYKGKEITLEFLQELALYDSGDDANRDIDIYNLKGNEREYTTGYYDETMYTTANGVSLNLSFQVVKVNELEDSTAYVLIVDDVTCNINID